MEKIYRLSLFNLKKNKKEAIAIAFLTLVSVLILCSQVKTAEKSVSNEFKDRT